MSNSVLSPEEVGEAAASELTEKFKHPSRKEVPRQTYDQWQRVNLPAMSNKTFKEYMESPYWQDGDIHFVMAEALRRIP